MLFSAHIIGQTVLAGILYRVATFFLNGRDSISNGEFSKDKLCHCCVLLLQNENTIDSS